MDHRSRRLLHLLPCAFLLSCGGSPPAESTEAVPSPPPAVPGDLPSREEFVRGGLALAAWSRASLREALGEPDSIASEVIPNRHLPGAIDTLFIVYYPELAVHIHRPGPGGELVSSAYVGSNQYLKYPVIGVAEGAIETAFGPPDEESGDTLTYLCTNCIAADDPVHLFLERGRVEGVRFNYYVD